jgi:hypothetical protein
MRIGEALTVGPDQTRSFADGTLDGHRHREEEMTRPRNPFGPQTGAVL